MDISLIVAHGKNREIGKDNKLLWYISEDLKNFKRLTLNHILIMGRKTFESIGRPLPKRQTIVLTRQQDFSAPGVLVAHSVEDAIELAQECPDFKQEELFIAGGGEIYQLFLPMATKLYLTSIDMEIEADTFFPQLDLSSWKKQSETVLNDNPKALFSLWIKP